MKNNSLTASLLAILTSTLCAAAPALAQDFLSPVTPQAPSFAGNGALNSGGAVGNLSNSSNFLTGPGAYNAGLPNGRPYSLQTTQNALLAPSSVSGQAIPLAQAGGVPLTYGFNQPPAFSINPFQGPNQMGNYAGQSLPVVSTGSVDINSVDCPYLRESYGTGSTIVNPLNLNLNIPGLGNINLQETPASAINFIDNSVDAISGFFGF